MTRADTFGASNAFQYEDERTILRIHPVDRSGGVVSSVSLVDNQHLLLQAAQEQDSEKVQIILADKPKLYAFGRQHRFFSYTGKILDTSLEQPVVSGDSVWTGKGYTEFVSFFEEEASLSACARKQQLVGMYYAGKAVFGAINNLSMANNSTNPHEYDVVFTMFVVGTYE